MKHPFSDKDIAELFFTIEGLTGCQITGNAWPKAVQALWDSAVARGAVQHTGSFVNPNEVRGYFIKLTRGKDMSDRHRDKEIAESLGWRVSFDPWWNWHTGPIFDPPGDEWCIRKDGRNDLRCNEALPHFSMKTVGNA